jgi:hypothetical protein
VVSNFSSVSAHDENLFSMRAKVVVYLPCRDQGGCLKSRVDERCGGRVPGVFFFGKEALPEEK